MIVSCNALNIVLGACYSREGRNPVFLPAQVLLDFRLPQNGNQAKIAVIFYAAEK